MCDIVFLIDEKNTSVKFTVATIVSLHKSLCAPVNSNSTVTSSHLSRKQKNAFVKLSANITFHLLKWLFPEKIPYSKQLL